MKNSIFLNLSLLVLFLISCKEGPNKQIVKESMVEFDEAKELKAIMDVIDQETKCFFDGNYECWMETWSHESYGMQAWNNSDGTSDVAIGWKQINNQGKTWIEEIYKKGENKHHPKFKRQEPHVKFFSDNLAYLHWEQHNANPDETYWNVSYDTRLMEKKDGKWKIVNVTSFWGSKPDIPIDSLKLK